MAINLGITDLGGSSYKEIFAGIHPPMEVTDIVIAAGQNLKRGSCLGKKTLLNLNEVDVTVQANTNNTGNGSFVLDTPSVGIGIKAGVYKVVFIDNNGTFQVVDPDQQIIGTGTIGNLFDVAVRFTIMQGSVNFVEGDSFDITVTFPVGFGKYYLWNMTANDGTEILAGILGCDVNATGGDEKGFMYVHGEFLKDSLTAGHTIVPGVYNNGSIVIKEDK